ncbi:MAG: tyrosine--tRNA ligase [Alphaproteobacteria bacterium]|nr:tyrosine--tRNA ligase [Alphaproteobacteria bacterium]
MTLSFKSDFMNEAADRGFIHQGTDMDQLDTLMAEGPVTAYLGFDMTARSLHVGSLLQIMWLRLLQKTGHKPIVLLGDGTTRIGDPSFKDTSRPMISEEEIEANAAGIGQVFDKYLTFGDGPTDAKIVRNYSWLKKLNYLEFLDKYGRHFSVNRMLSFDSVKLRLDREQPLSFLEFNYMILQAYDFLELSRTEGCILQLGGSDQWGNILNGVELIRRLERKEAFGLTSPLLTTASGEKMGKTAQGAVWLNADMRSPFEFWQFWRNTDDRDVGTFLRLFTELPLDEIAKLEALQGAEINAAKKILADETTRLCHGEEAVAAARETAKGLFEAGVSSLEALPHFNVTVGELEEGLSVLDLLVRTELCQSKGEARRLVRGNGARLNEAPLSDEDAFVNIDDFKDGELKLSSGKKRHALVCLS